MNSACGVGCGVGALVLGNAHENPADLFDRGHVAAPRGDLTFVLITDDQRWGRLDGIEGSLCQAIDGLDIEIADLPTTVLYILGQTPGSRASRAILSEENLQLPHHLLLPKDISE
jgi:hypothetical protein